MLSVRTFLPVIAIALTFLPAAASADNPVPLKGRARETITALNVTAAGIEVTTIGEGNSTHLGRFFRAAHVLIRPDGTVTGITGWLSADGDALILSLEAVPLSATEFAGTYTIVFGNGRFAGASGGAEFLASTTDGVNYGLTFAGEIDY